MTNNKQQTAVEYLIHHIRQDVFVHSKSTKEWNQVFQQAKAMEKEQHATTWDKSMDNLDARGGNIVRAWVDFDEYYEQTYK